MSQNDTNRRIELYAHPTPAASERTREFSSRLTALVEAGQVDSVVRRVIPQQIVPDTFGESCRTVERVLECFDWATRTGTTLHPAFERRVVDDELLGEQYELISTPALFVMVFEDDELVQVLPTATDDTLSVDRCIPEQVNVERSLVPE